MGGRVRAAREGSVIRPSGEADWARAAQALRPDPFAFLVSAVTYQQLAGGAAATIHGRLVAALGGGVTPASVRRPSDDALRAAGLSRAKLASIRDLAEQVAAGAVALDHLRDLSDEGVVERLVRVRGIGRWTAEMLLIFHLRRPDVWPAHDLGVRAVIARLLGWGTPPDARELGLIGTGYRPWRSATAWYRWRAVETLPPG